MPASTPTTKRPSSTGPRAESCWGRGAGFLLLYCPPENHDRLRHALADLQELEFSFDSFGTQVIYYEESRVWQSAPQGPAGKGKA